MTGKREGDELSGQRSKPIDTEMRYYINRCVIAYQAGLYFCADEYASSVCNTYLSQTVYDSDKEALNTLISIFENIESYRNAEALKTLLSAIEGAENTSISSPVDTGFFKAMKPLITEEKRAEIRSLSTEYDSKYCRDFDRNFGRAMYMFRWLSPIRDAKILDIGTGFGFFPYVCKHNGHVVHSIDMEDLPEEYDICTKMLNLEKRHFTIERHLPLPEFPHRYDVITAHQVCFNGHGSNELWDVGEWLYFLTDLHDNALAKDGFLSLIFNHDNWVVDGNIIELGRKSVEDFFEPHLITSEEMKAARLTRDDIAALVSLYS
jgi:hypothetical protein